MSTLNPVPIPLSDPIASPARENFRKSGEKDPREGMLTLAWLDYFTNQSQLLGEAPARVGQSVQLASQFASLGATDFSGGVLSGGLYRINYYVRVTQAATVSSSITVTFDWSDGGVVVTFPGTAETGNTTGTYQSNSFPIHIDSLSPVRASTTYASVGGTPMQYSLFCVLEGIPL